MNKLPKLSNRLQAIADMVPYNSAVADIGTDHAYIPIYLVNKGISSIAYASDIKTGPILRAEAEIKRFGAQDRVETRIGGGLNSIKCGEADTVVIAGMGGILISNILNQSKDVLSQVTVLILQPMTAVYELRKYLFENSYTIADEILVKEDGKLYTIIKAVHGTEDAVNEIQLHIGKRLIEKKDSLLPELLSRNIIRLNKRINGLSVAKHTENRESKLKACRALLSQMEELKAALLP